jgi:type III pantothenate kinase
MIAAIDSGNSHIKLGIFDKAKLIKSYNSVDEGAIAGILSGDQVKRVVISDVGGRLDRLVEELSGKIPVLSVQAGLKFPFRISYKTPETLGTDRIAAVAGAWDKFGPADILVIDTGSCITYDFIDHEGNYHGGGISPGIAMRLKSLHTFTAGLPEIEPQDDFGLLGTDTRSSMINGTVGGVVEEIKGLIKNFQHNNPGIKTVLCGGNAVFFESRLKGTIFVVPGLVLYGLVVISGYNEI